MARINYPSNYVSDIILAYDIHQDICGPGEDPWKAHLLKADFAEDVLGSLLDDPQAKEELLGKLEKLQTTGQEVNIHY